VLLVAIWELAYNVFQWGWKFPSPVQTYQSFYTGVTEGPLLNAAFTSLRRLLTAFAIAIAIGTLLGILFAQYRMLDDTFGFLVVALQTIPSIAWLPFAIIWFGLNDISVVFITAIGATWTMAMASRTGILNIPKQYLQAARMMGTRGFPLFFKVILPAAFPQMITGLRTGWAFAWRALVSAELIARGIGLGQLLQDGRSLGDTASMLSIVILIAIIGTVIDHLVFRQMENRLMVRYGIRSTVKN